MWYCRRGWTPASPALQFWLSRSLLVAPSVSRLCIFFGTFSILLLCVVSGCHFSFVHVHINFIVCHIRHEVRTSKLATTTTTTMAAKAQVSPKKTEIKVQDTTTDWSSTDQYAIDSQGPLKQLYQTFEHNSCQTVEIQLC